MSVSGYAPVMSSDGVDTNFNIFEAISGDIGMAAELEDVRKAMALLKLLDDSAAATVVNFSTLMSSPAWSGPE